MLNFHPNIIGNKFINYFFPQFLILINNENLHIFKIHFNGIYFLSLMFWVLCFKNNL
jgi:hypothetical protein